jgi:hypothetical protein
MASKGGGGGSGGGGRGRSGGASPEKQELEMAKEAILDYFGVEKTSQLKDSYEYRVATEGMGKDLRNPENVKALYREFVGILPSEKNPLPGPTVMNGVDVIKYFRPWQAFGLNPKTATEKDIRRAYRQASKIYHPDNPVTGDKRMFERINTMYRSIDPSAYRKSRN